MELIHYSIIIFQSPQKAHCVVEWEIGQLKWRFHVQHGEVRVSPPLNVCKIIQACGMLHNICKEQNIPLLDEDQPMGAVAEVSGSLQQSDFAEESSNAAGSHRNEGCVYRDAFLSFK